MKRVFEEKISECQVIIAENAGSYRGVVLRNGKQEASLDGQDLDQLKAALRNQAGILHPEYYGIKGAKDRFLRFFPKAFDDPEYKKQERDYKDQARAALLAAAPLELALEGDNGLAARCRKGTSTNLLSQFEAARLSEVLASSEGGKFLRAAAAFATLPDQKSLTAMGNAIAPHGRVSWPLVTYFPFLWNPDEHMFLKPTATLDFATRVGDKLARTYEAAMVIGVYEDLLELATDTNTTIADLQPKDRIDVQSFIWVVGSYKDEDVPVRD